MSTTEKNFPSSKYEFLLVDISKDFEAIPQGELVLIKDVLQHWTEKDIYNLLDYLTTERLFRYIMLIDCCNQTSSTGDIGTGEGCPLNSEFYPLLKYKPERVLLYNTKEVSIIVHPDL